MDASACRFSSATNDSPRRPPRPRWSTPACATGASAAASSTRWPRSSSCNNSWIPTDRLHKALGLTQPLGAIDVSFYRDDFGSKGLHPQPQRTDVPFVVEGADVIIVDDVLYTGRTTRAAINELFDYGRPARVDLAVLVDRGGRELPIAARYCALTLPEPLPARQNLQLECDPSGALTLRLIDA